MKRYTTDQIFRKKRPITRIKKAIIYQHKRDLTRKFTKYRGRIGIWPCEGTILTGRYWLRILLVWTFDYYNRKR